MSPLESEWNSPEASSAHDWETPGYPTPQGFPPQTPAQAQTPSEVAATGGDGNRQILPDGNQEPTGTEEIQRGSLWSVVNTETREANPEEDQRRRSLWSIVSDKSEKFEKSE